MQLERATADMRSAIFASCFIFGADLVARPDFCTAKNVIVYRVIIIQVRKKFNARKITRAKYEAVIESDGVGIANAWSNASLVDVISKLPIARVRNGRPMHTSDNS